jgi:Putative prokaryotic signal transducing protein
VQCVHETSNRTIAQLLRSALESEGIPAIVQGEHLMALQGEIPVGASARFRVCIVDADQLPVASYFTRRWLAPGSEPSRGWSCRCGERHEPHFVSCWKCGAERAD